jgi:hypothetical protein
MAPAQSQRQEQGAHRALHVQEHDEEEAEAAARYSGLDRVSAGTVISLSQPLIRRPNRKAHPMRATSSPSNANKVHS